MVLTLGVVMSAVTMIVKMSMTDAKSVPLTMLNSDEYPLAKCLDGTQAGYYYQEAPHDDDKNKWVIYLNGGGECDNKESCEYHKYDALGSSNYFASESDPSGWYLGSDYCDYNPDLCGWNHVLDPYCTQDLHSGQVTELSDDNWNLYFSGHLVFEATLDALDKAENSLKNATEIILFGVSAGGIGVWMNVDYLAKRYPNARVTAATVAGFYFYATYYTGPNATDPGGMADFREAAFPETYDLYQAFVDEDCKSDFESKGEHPGPCILSNISYPYIQADSFVIQSQTDSVVLTGHDNWPSDYMNEEPEQEFMTEWSTNMSVALKPLLELEEASSTLSSENIPRSGVFAAACYTHGGFTHSYPLIDDMNFYTAFGNFYFHRTESSKYKLSDDCGVMCNPTCAV